MKLVWSEVSREVSMEDVRRMHNKFYSDSNRDAQQKFIHHHVIVHNPERKRSTNNDGSEHNRKHVTVNYFISVLREHNKTEQMEVC